MAQEPDRNMMCSKCGVVTTHRVFNVRDANGRVTSHMQMRLVRDA